MVTQDVVSEYPTQPDAVVSGSERDFLTLFVQPTLLLSFVASTEALRLASAVSYGPCIGLVLGLGDLRDWRQVRTPLVLGIPNLRLPGSDFLVLPLLFPTSLQQHYG